MAKKPERRLARAILAIEPGKVDGGSPARARWIGLLTETQVYLQDFGWDADAFRKALTKGV